MKNSYREILIILRDSAIVVLLCFVIGVLFNAFRKGGIPFIRKESYEIFVPCPEPLGSPSVMNVQKFLSLKDEKVLIVDARSEEDYKFWHYPGAINVPFDYLMPVCQVKLREIASSGAQMVIVYGDGGDPDSGRELARELAGNGIRNVHFIEGGFKTLIGTSGSGKK